MAEGGRQALALLGISDDTAFISRASDVTVIHVAWLTNIREPQRPKAAAQEPKMHTQAGELQGPMISSRAGAVVMG